MVYQSLLGQIDKYTPTAAFLIPFLRRSQGVAHFSIAMRCNLEREIGGELVINCSAVAADASSPVEATDDAARKAPNRATYPGQSERFHNVTDLQITSNTQRLSQVLHNSDGATFQDC